MPLSKLEQSLAETIAFTHQTLSQGYVKKQDYYHLLGVLRNAMIKARNVQAGCAQGVHTTACECTEEEYVRTLQYRKYSWSKAPMA